MYSIRSVLIFLTLFLAILTPSFSQQDPKETARQYLEQAELILGETKAMDDARELIHRALAGHPSLFTICSISSVVRPST